MELSPLSLRYNLVNEDKNESEAKVSELVTSLRKDMDRRFQELNSRVTESMESGRKVIRERPLLAVGVATAVGLVLGLLVGTRNKR